ncbi:hypothetical protein PBAL39_16219 [Pedobacter sp. BAL39]|uniref:hypothetical protein n=1 Tax=Pedobacter sp. BAL39 TaxID=391596 RepID=UPI00015593CC|nr:hypothetical protein [Pedobacter sp. BAL39]EDM37987.1 hypothetical protein PBAL39_16219 [Pedobacter sp. BAL39]
MHFIKIMTFSIILFILTFVTTYLSMQIFADQPSASCMGCSYLKDTFFYSVFSLMTIPFVLLLMNRVIINKTRFAVVITVVFIFIVLMNNVSLFQDRVSSWSSYSTKDEIVATVFHAYPWMITGSFIVFLVFYSTYKVPDKR